METVEKKYSPELRWTLFKIRLLDEDDAAEVLESYAHRHAIEFGNELITWLDEYMNLRIDTDISERYTEWINTKDRAAK